MMHGLLICILLACDRVLACDLLLLFVKRLAQLTLTDSCRAWRHGTLSRTYEMPENDINMPYALQYVCSICQCYIMELLWCVQWALSIFGRVGFARLAVAENRAFFDGFGVFTKTLLAGKFGGKNSWNMFVCILIYWLLQKIEFVWRFWHLYQNPSGRQVWWK